MAEHKRINKKIVTGEHLGAIMDEDRITEIAKREIAKERVAGPKTLEGQKNSLRNLRPRSKIPTDLDELEGIPNIDIEELPDKERIPLWYLGSYKILSQEEQGHYVKKWLEYIEDFEFNDSSDEAQLHVLIMEEIVYNRLMRSQLSNPHEDLSKQITECMKRHGDALKGLGISRSQRLGTKAGKEENIATLIQQFDTKKTEELAKESAKMLSEEEELMNRKRRDFEEDLSSVNVLQEGSLDKKEDLVHEQVTTEDIEKQTVGEKVRQPKVGDALRNILKEAAIG